MPVLKNKPMKKNLKDGVDDTFEEEMKKELVPIAMDVKEPIMMDLKEHKDGSVLAADAPLEFINKIPL